ncbi:MAG: SelB C-terminal domain-containing protein, partial [Spirochaetaceae bacterium]|nr:SelB C-terminal domain-containing protein [Spirochaetaceae bacterium]
IDGFFLNFTNDMRSSLSPMAGKLLSDLEEENSEINLSNISNPLFADTYKALGRMKLLKILQGELIISYAHFTDLKKKVLKGLSIGDEFPFSTVKESLQLSRRILIPLLEELDSEGYFQREGDSRIVLKID